MMRSMIASEMGLPESGLGSMRVYQPSDWYWVQKIIERWPWPPRFPAGRRTLGRERPDEPLVQDQQVHLLVGGQTFLQLASAAGNTQLVEELRHTT